MPSINPRILAGDISYLSELPKPKSNKGVGCTEKEIKYLHILYENFIGNKGKTQGQMLVEAGYSPKTAINPLKKRSCVVYLLALCAKDRENRNARWKRIENKIFEYGEQALDRLNDLAINAENEQVRATINKAQTELMVRVKKESEAPAIQISNSYEQIIFNATTKGITAIEETSKLITQNETNTIPVTISNII